jgi:hypothetical protein
VELLLVLVVTISEQLLLLECSDEDSVATFQHLQLLS